MLAFSNLLCLDVSRNNLMDLPQLPPKLQQLHAYENNLSELHGGMLPSLLHAGLGSRKTAQRGARRLGHGITSTVSAPLCSVPRRSS